MLISELFSKKAILKLWDVTHYFLGRISLEWKITIILILLFSVVYIATYYKGKKIGFLKRLSISVFPSYILFIIVMTLFIRLPNNEVSYKLMPFWSYIEIFRHGSANLIIDNLLNLIVFMPFGFFIIAIHLNETRTNKFKTFKFLLLSTALFSTIIEFIQLVSRHGCCEFDDVLNNVFGSAVGGLICILITFRRKRNFNTSREE